MTGKIGLKYLFKFLHQNRPSLQNILVEGGRNKWGWGGRPIFRKVTKKYIYSKNGVFGHFFFKKY
jgi:hypothetical protein